MDRTESARVQWLAGSMLHSKKYGSRVAVFDDLAGRLPAVNQRYALSESSIAKSDC
jgi:hypothetical protein